MESWKPTRTNREAGPSKDTGTREMQSTQVQVLKETAGDNFRCVVGVAGG